MKLLILAAVFYASFNSTPVKACHIYSIWHYKYPQHCSSGRSPIGRDSGLKIHPVGVQIPSPALEDKNWYIEIIKPPPDEKGSIQIIKPPPDKKGSIKIIKPPFDERNQALDKLKGIMK